MKERVLKHDGSSRTVIRIIGEPAPAPVTRALNPLESLLLSCRRVEAQAARIAAAVKPVATKPTVAEMAAGILASKRRTRGSINRFSRHAGGGAVIVAQREVVAKSAHQQPKPYEPDESAVLALRAAFGLGVRKDQVQDTRKSLIQDTRQAEKVAKARKDAASAKPTVIDGGTGGTVLHSPPTSVSPASFLSPPQANDAVWFFIHEQFIKNKRVPVTISVSEISRATGFSVEVVQAALNALEKSGQLQAFPVRGGGPKRYAPVL